MSLEVKTVRIPRDYKQWKMYGDHPEPKDEHQVIGGDCWHFIPFPVLPVTVTIFMENGISYHEYSAYNWSFHRKRNPEDEEGIMISKGGGPLADLTIKILYERT